MAKTRVNVMVGMVLLHFILVWSQRFNKRWSQNKTKKTPLEMKDAKLACLVPTLQNNKYCIR